MMVKTLHLLPSPLLCKYFIDNFTDAHYRKNLINILIKENFIV